MKPGSLVVHSDAFDRGIVLRPVGDIDLSRSAALRDAIAAANQRRPDRLLVDLSEVTYMDSSGVATLVEALQVARRQRTTLLLCGLQPRVRSVFEIARLDQVFSIHPDRDSAIAAC